METAYWEKRFQSLLPELKVKFRTQNTPFVCPLLDLGDFVLREFNVLLDFFERFAEEAIDARQKEAKSYFANADDGSAYLYFKQRSEAMRAIVAQFKDTAERCTEIWAKAPKPVVREEPSRFVPINARPSYRLSLPQVAIRTDVDAQTPSSDGESAFDRMDEDSNTEIFSDELSDESASPTQRKSPVAQSSWKRKGRGKDNEMCPHGRKCDRGGWDFDKNKPVIFERNSAFNAHMARHDRPFVCDQCSKTFGRKAAVARHKERVHHRSSTVKFVQTREVPVSVP